MSDIEGVPRRVGLRGIVDGVSAVGKFWAVCRFHGRLFRAEGGEEGKAAKGGEGSVFLGALTEN